MTCIEEWDKLAESRGLNSQEWLDRYEKENELVAIYEAEELMWQRTGGENWLLQGDSNTRYFHGGGKWQQEKMFNKEFG